MSDHSKPLPRSVSSNNITKVGTAAKDLMHVGLEDVPSEANLGTGEQNDADDSKVVTGSLNDENSKAEPQEGDKSSKSENSLAFLILAKLQEEGKIKKDEADAYRNMYSVLNRTVVAVYNNETYLYSTNIEQKKDLASLNATAEERRKKLDHLKVDLESTIEGRERTQKDVDSKRMELEVVENELQSYQDQENEKQRALEEMVRNSDEAAKPLLDDLNNKIKLCLEEIKLQEENTEKEREAKELYIDEIERLKAAIEDLERDKHEKRRALVLSQHDPDKIRGAADSISRVRAKTEKEALTLAEKIQVLKAKAEEKAAIRGRVESEVSQQKQLVTRHREVLSKQAGELADIEAKLENFKQGYKNLSEKRESVKVEIEQYRHNLRIATGKMNRNKKQNLQDMKLCERLKRKLSTVKGIIPSLADQRDLLVLDITRAKKEMAEIEAKIKEMLSDKDVLLYTHLEIEDKDSEVSVQLQIAQKKVQKEKEQIEKLQKREVKLQRTIGEWATKRELQAKVTSEAINSCSKMKELLKMKNLVLGDLIRQEEEDRAIVQLHQEEYKRIKSIKEKYVHQVQVAEQALNEIREKISILQHEVQILNQESHIRESAYKEEVRNHQILVQRRMRKRDERGALKSDYKKVKQHQQHQLKEIEQLNTIVNTLAKKTTKIRTKYAEAVEQRNSAGVRVIDVNDELSILSEKAKIQQDILSKGTVELRLRDSQLDDLRRETAEFERTRQALMKRSPSSELWYATRKTLETSKNVLQEERNKVLQFSEALANPEEPKPDGRTRINRLKGFDPDKEQLQTKIEVLEEKLAEKKERLFEKDLILHEVSALSDKLCKQAAVNRAWNLELAKKMNEYQAQIRNTTRSMMAAVSELSMYQATAMKLEQERKGLAEAFADALVRTKEGKAPTDEAFGEWIRMMRERQRQRDTILANKKKIKELMKARPGHIPSTVEARPNAYIPDELGIPKPYGRLAPFKASVLGSNMRHLRRSVER